MSSSQDRPLGAARAAEPETVQAQGNMPNTLMNANLAPLQGCESILRAAQQNDPGLIRDMVSLLGVPPSYPNVIGQTALHVAVLWGHVDCVKVLLELGANVNAANSIMGFTPLHTVLSSPKVANETKEEITNLLIDAGANVGMEDRDRKCPIEYVPMDHPNRQQLRGKLKPPKRNARDMLLNDVLGSVGMCRMAPPGPPSSSA